MARVSSEYAGELAVVATWLTALMPWSVSVLNPVIAGDRWLVVNIRFVFFQLAFRYRNGQPVDFAPLQPVWNVAPFGSVTRALRPGDWAACNPAVTVPCDQALEARVWLVAAVLFALPVLASVVYYAREDLVESTDADPVRVFGVAFAAVALLLTAATVMFYQHQPTVPVGTLFAWAFAALLLRVDRT